MATYTPNKALPLPTVGGDSNLWGTELNNGLNILDSALGGQNATTITAAGGVIAISVVEAQDIIQKVTGAPTAEATLLLPANQGGFFVFENECTGTATVAVGVGTTAALGGTISVPNGSNAAVFSDGTNAGLATTYVPGMTPPAGIQFGDIKHSSIGVEGAGWRLCNGQTRPQTDPLWTYITNNSIAWPWGHTGSSTYNMPNAQDVVLAGLDGMGGAASPGLITQAVAGFNPATLGVIGGNQHAQKDTIAASSTAASTATSTPNDPGHGHPILASSAEGGIASLAGAGSNGVAGATGTTSVYTTYPGGEPTTRAIELASTGITVATSVTTTVTTTATSSLTGTSQNIQPVMMVPILMYVGA